MEDGIPDVLDRLRYQKKSQTYQKLSVLAGAYSQIAAGLAPFAQSSEVLQEIYNRRSEFVRAISDKAVTWYLHQLGRDNL